MCNPCLLIVGCNTVPAKTETPEGYPDAPENVFCSYCSKVGNSIYYRDNYVCHLCFIPCCPCGRSDPYLACSNCHHKIGSVNHSKCHTCGVVTAFESNNCPCCGAQKGPGRSNHSDTKTTKDSDDGYHKLDL